MSLDNEFTLTPQLEEAFENIKKVICNNTMLRFFALKTPIILYADALTSKGWEQQFTSHSLTGRETRYSNIDREILAISI